MIRSTEKFCLGCCMLLFVSKNSASMTSTGVRIRDGTILIALLPSILVYLLLFSIDYIHQN